MSWARGVAWRILMEVEKTGQNPRTLLDARISGAKDRPVREHALAAHLVFSVLRWRLKLDWMLNRLSRTPLKRCSLPVRTALRLGAAQLVLLDRIPDYAAVNDTVGLLKHSQPPWVTGFVNGVLRNLAAQGASVLNALDEEPTEVRLSVTFSHPRWLVRRWVSRLGEQTAIELMKANNEEAPRTIRVNRLRGSKGQVRDALEALGARVVDTPFSPDGLFVRDLTGPLERTALWKEGCFEIQDEGAQLATHLASPGGRRRVLDLCAGRGGKTGYLAQLSSGLGEILAVDQSLERLRLLMDNMNRQRVGNVTVVRADALSLAPEELGGTFDVVFLDAPCSGLGALRRQPDLRWNKSESSVARSAERQRNLLRAASNMVSPGGVLVYCTCSTEPEENEDNVSWFLKTRAGFRLDPVAAFLPSENPSMADKDGFFRAFPHLHNTDGFFGARFVRADA